MCSCSWRRSRKRTVRPWTHPSRQQTRSPAALRLLLGTVEIMSVYLGDRLGWYASLAPRARRLLPSSPPAPTHSPASARVARATGRDRPAHGRRPTAHPTHVVYAIPPSTTEVMTDVSSLAYLAPIGRMFGAVGPALPRLLEAYRTGGGVSWDDLGPDARESQADANRPWYESRLAPALSGHQHVPRPSPGRRPVARRRQRRRLVEHRPRPRVPRCRRDSASTSTSNRSTMATAQRPGRGRGRPGHLPPPGRLDPAAADGFDAAFAFECVHDMPRPVDVLSAVRTALAPGGTAGRHGRGCRRGVRAERRRPRTDDVRLQPLRLPPRRAVEHAERRDRHRHAPVDPARATARRPASRTSRYCRSRTSGSGASTSSRDNSRSDGQYQPLPCLKLHALHGVP